MKRAALFLLLASCSDSDGWTARAKRWCAAKNLICEVDYVRDEVGIVQPEGQEAFTLRCEEKLCAKADVTPESDTFIYMPSPSQTTYRSH